MLRNKFVADARRRFKWLDKQIEQLVLTEDAFGLKRYGLLANSRWMFETDPDKLRSFQAWLKEQVDAGILSVPSGFERKPWMSPYIMSAYKQGLVRSFLDVRKQDFSKTEDFYQQGQEQFLNDAFGRGGMSTDQVEMLALRAFDQMSGITGPMSAKMSRVLADGLVHGNGADSIARDLAEEVGITRNRAEMIARTEVVHSYAEGQLDALEALGIHELEVDVEWTTSGQNVCPECESLEGVVIPISEARGMIPRHPNCKCAWRPAGVGEKQKGQRRGDRALEAIRESIRIEFPNDSLKEARGRTSWPGADLID